MPLSTSLPSSPFLSHLKAERRSRRRKDKRSLLLPLSLRLASSDPATKATRIHVASGKQIHCFLSSRSVEGRRLRFKLSSSLAAADANRWFPSVSFVNAASVFLLSIPHSVFAMQSIDLRSLAIRSLLLLLRLVDHFAAPSPDFLPLFSLDTTTTPCACMWERESASSSFACSSRLPLLQLLSLEGEVGRPAAELACTSLSSRHPPSERGTRVLTRVQSNSFPPPTPLACLLATTPAAACEQRGTRSPSLIACQIHCS